MPNRSGSQGLEMLYAKREVTRYTAKMPRARKLLRSKYVFRNVMRAKVYKPAEFRKYQKAIWL